MSLASHLSFRATAIVTMMALTAPVFAQSGVEPAASTAAARPLAESLTGQAKTEYDLGRILYRDGDYGGAAVKFAHAYELSKDPRLLWNVAACEKNLRRYVRTLELLRQYKAEGATTLSARELEEAEKLIEVIGPFISTVTVVVNEPGASVSVDGAIIGETPLSAPVSIEMGDRVFQVSKPGFHTQSRTEKLAGGSEARVEFSLSKEIHEGTLVVKAGPNDTISIDGKVVGAASYEGVLASGGHTLRITAKGKRPYQAEILIKDNDRRVVEVTLDDEKSGSAPWLWITGGAVLAAGAVVGGYFLFKPGDPNITPGTITPHTVQVRGFRFGGL